MASLITSVVATSGAVAITPAASAQEKAADVTVTETAAPTTATETVTNAPKSTVTTTVENRTEERVERTTVVERYYRKYEYGFDFSQKKEERYIVVEKLSDWKIDFVDDSKGLVKVTKSKDGLVITPVKEGEGDVRIVVVDNEGNRHEYTIHVINKAQKEITTKDVVVNNHYFNVTVAGASQEIQIPKGWDYTIEEGGAYITTTQKGDKVIVTPNEGVISAKAKISVHEPGERPRNENNYIFNIAPDSKFDQHRVIGNSNAYKLEIDNAQGEPKIIEGEDIVDSLKKNDQGVWVLTPKSDKTGKVVITIKDAEGNTHQFTFDVRQGNNVLVDVVTETVSVGDDFILNADGDYELDFKQGEDIADVNKANGKITITPNAEGVIVANLYENVDGNRVLVGTYTLISTPAGVKVDTQEVTQEIKDRQTVEITKGAEDHEIVVVEGKDKVTVAEVEKDGKTVTRLMPDEGFEGKVVVEERRGDDVVVRYTINVTKSEVREYEQDVNEGSTVYVNRTSDLQRIVVVEGENLLKNAPKGDEKQFVPEFVDGAEGKVVIELQNSRGLPVTRWILNLTPAKASEFTYNVTDRSEVTLTTSENSTYKIIEGEELITVEGEGTDFVVTPNKGAKGTAIIEFTNGTKTTRYVLNITPVNGGAGSDTTTGESSFKVSELGNFTVTVRNENTYEVIKGGDYVTVTKKDGKWILTPNKDTAGNFVTVVEKTKTGEVVNRHIIEITKQERELKFTEVRKTIDPKIESWETPGKGNTLRIVRGYDLVENPDPDEHGKLTLKPIEGKTGTILIEERDANGNPVRIIEAEIPETSGGETIEKPEITRNDDGSITIVVKEKGDLEFKVCTDKNPPKDAKDCKNLKPIDDKYIKDNGDGSYTIENGGIPDGTTALVVTPKGSENSFIFEINIETDNNQGAGNVNVGSSDPKCIASLVGLASPLLLLIPLGVLSQVHIPGLEGLRGQLNSAIREANDRIQHGLGIYDRDRAERAAGLQGAFAIENSEMIGMAAGALGVITAGLLIGDAVLRACGQEESTSSYQLGKATNNDTLMYGSSGKPAETEAAKPEEGSAAEK